MVVFEERLYKIWKGGSKSKGLVAGIAEQGLYRNCGVNSKVKKLMTIGLEKRKGSAGEKSSWFDDGEWEVKTVTSALKTYLR